MILSYQLPVTFCCGCYSSNLFIVPMGAALAPLWCRVAAKHPSQGPTEHRGIKRRWNYTLRTFWSNTLPLFPGKPGNHVRIHSYCRSCSSFTWVFMKSFGLLAILFSFESSGPTVMSITKDWPRWWCTLKETDHTACWKRSLSLLPKQRGETLQDALREYSGTT